MGVGGKSQCKRGQLGLATRSFIAMMERGYRSASYTEVLDD